jgi:hypothetical protein
MTPSLMRSPTKFEDRRSNPFQRKHCGPTEARNSLKSPLSGQYRHHRPPEMASYGGTDMDRGRWAILKMAARITITDPRLVDTIVLEGMGLPTAGVNSRSKLPTDPTALVVRQ